MRSSVSLPSLGRPSLPAEERQHYTTKGQRVTLPVLVGTAPSVQMTPLSPPKQPAYAAAQLSVSEAEQPRAKKARRRRGGGGSSEAKEERDPSPGNWRRGDWAPPPLLEPPMARRPPAFNNMPPLASGWQRELEILQARGRPRFVPPSEQIIDELYRPAPTVDPVVRYINRKMNRPIVGRGSGGVDDARRELKEGWWNL